MSSDSDPSQLGGDQRFESCDKLPSELEFESSMV